jgi:opacity protein-like surface antigen
VCCVAIAPAHAQSVYVGASAGADFARFGRFADDNEPSFDVGGNSFAIAVKAGASIAEHWGVQLEFVHPAITTHSAISDSAFIPFPGIPGQSAASLTFIASLGLPAEFRVAARRRNSSLATLAWARQELTSRMAVYYLAGLGFHRFSQETSIEVTRGIVAGVDSHSRAVGYSAGPAAGIDIRYALTEHLQFVPGVRLHAFNGGWITRTSAGVDWTF